MKKRNVILLALAMLFIVMCSPKPAITKPVYMLGTMVSPGIN